MTGSGPQGQGRRGVVLAIILAGYLLILLDVSILMAALPQIDWDLGFSPAGLSWAQNAYTLAFGGLLLLGARAGDLVGRRRMFIAGIGVFAAASLAVGLAQSPAWMISARALQGVGAAMLAPSTLALLSTSFPDGAHRTRAMAAYGALAGIGTAAGLLLGGALTQTLSWRYGFFVNVPVAAVAMVLAPRFLPETTPRPGRLDLTGGLCSTLGVSVIVFGVVHSADAGWTGTTTLAAVAAGVLPLLAFVRSQQHAAQPIMPLRLFADRERAGAYAARFLFNGGLVSFYFFMTQYLQGVTGFNPLQAGLAFLPVTLAAFAAAAATPRLLQRVSTAALSITGCVAMLAGTLWFSRMSASTGYLAGVVVPMLVFGVGHGVGLSTLTTAGMVRVAPEDAGIAGGLVNVAHHLGGAVGLGILVTVFDNAGAGIPDPRELLTHRVSAAFLASSVLLALAVAIAAAARPRRREPVSEPFATPSPQTTTA